jgi:hypothetical protein
VSTLTVGPTDCSAAAVNSAIARAADGDTVLLTCTGTQSWTSTVFIPSTKGITLRVQGGTNTPKSSAVFPLTITSSADPIISVTCENHRSPVRISGFRFQNTIASTAGAILVGGRGRGPTGHGAFRIDNNLFDDIRLPHADLEGTITMGTRSATGILTGLADNNTFRNASWTDGYSIAVNEGWRAGESSFAHAGGDAWRRPLGWGTSDFMFIEDNLFENPSRYTRHYVAGHMGAKYVARYNVFRTDTAGIGNTDQLDAHGYCLCRSLGHGSRGGEIYGNTFTGTRVGREMILRGGAWLVYDNTFTRSPAITLFEYRAGNSSMCNQCSPACASASPGWATCVATDAHYPMSEQIGADYDRHSSPSYFWNNLFHGTNQSPVVDGRGLQPTYIRIGRDYFVTMGKPASLSSYTPFAYPHPLRSAE